MRVYTIGDFKSNLADIIAAVRAGESIALAYGQKKEVVAHLVPPPKAPRQKRPLGLLSKKATVVFKKDFKMTESEFLGL